MGGPAEHTHTPPPHTPPPLTPAVLPLRLQDLHLYQPQLQSYQDSSASFHTWMEARRQEQEALQATRMDSLQALTDLISHQKVSFLLFLFLRPCCCRDVTRLSFCAAKALNSDILSKRETLDGVLKANVACCSSIQVRMLAFCPPPTHLSKP